MSKIDVEKLFETASDQVVALEEELYSLSLLLQRDYEFRQFMTNPLIPAASKGKLVLRLFPAATRIFQELIRLIIDEKLERQIVGLAEKLTGMVSERLNITYVNVKSPYPLSGQEMERIERMVGGKAQFRVEIDPALIGGVKLFTGDGRFFDGSVRGRLEKMKEKLAYV